MNNCTVWQSRHISNFGRNLPGKQNKRRQTTNQKIGSTINQSHAFRFSSFSSATEVAEEGTDDGEVTDQPAKGYLVEGTQEEAESEQKSKRLRGEAHSEGKWGEGTIGQNSNKTRLNL